MTLLICVQTSTKHSVLTSTTTTTTNNEHGNDGATTAPPPPPQLDNNNEGQGRVEHEKSAQTTRLTSSGP